MTRWAGSAFRAVALGFAVAFSFGGLVGCAGTTGQMVEIGVHYSHFSLGEIEVPVGVPITFILRNDDPIDHEWIVGDEAVHAAHRTGTEPVHDTRPTEVLLPALSTRTTTVTFAVPGRLLIICHLPAHEAYGMVGVLTVVP